MSHNLLTGQLYPVTVVDARLSVLDISYNRGISGIVPSSFQNFGLLQSLDCRGTALRGDLPTFLDFALDVSFETSALGYYQCPAIVDPARETVRVYLDPAYYAFANCRCNDGYFGGATVQDDDSVDGDAEMIMSCRACSSAPDDAVI
jgi:hypothetical protein